MLRTNLLQGTGSVMLVLLLGLGCAAVAAADDLDDEIYGWAVGDTIYVVHEAAYYNCCVLIVPAMELPEPGVVDFLEEETYPQGPCYCMCYIDVTMWGAGFEPGTYTIRVWNVDRTVFFGETEVEVTGPPGGAPALLDFMQTECYGATASTEEPDLTEDPETTWGTIKDLYR